MKEMQIAQKVYAECDYCKCNVAGAASLCFEDQTVQPHRKARVCFSCLIKVFDRVLGKLGGAIGGRDI